MPGAPGEKSAKSAGEDHKKSRILGDAAFSSAVTATADRPPLQQT
jgi:hypothetical protein